MEEKAPSLQQEFLRKFKDDQKEKWYEENKNIHLAAKFGFLEDVKEIVKKNPQVIAKTMNQRTPIEYALLYGQNSQVVLHLFQCGSTVPKKFRLEHCASNLDRELLKLYRKFGTFDRIPKLELEYLVDSPKFEENLEFNDRKILREREKNDQQLDEEFVKEEDSLYFTSMSLSGCMSKIFDEQIRQKERTLSPEIQTPEIDTSFDKKMKNIFERQKIQLIQSPIFQCMKENNIFQDEDEGVKSDCLIEFHYSDISVHPYKCHLFVILNRWKYFKDKYLKIDEKLFKEEKEKGSEFFKKRINQIIFEKISGLKEGGGGFVIKIKENDLDFTPSSFESFLKCLYTGNQKIFNELKQNHKQFGLFVEKYRVVESDIKTNLFTNKNMIKSLSSQLEETPQSNKNALTQYIDELIKLHLSDCTVKCQDDTFHCNKFLLINRMHFFALTLTGPFAESNEIIFENETTFAIEQILNFLYNDKCIITNENFVELTFLANKFLLSRLSRKIAKRVIKDVNEELLDFENIGQMLHLCQTYNLKRMESACFKRVCRILENNQFVWLQMKSDFIKYKILGKTAKKFKKKMALIYFVHLDHVKEPKFEDFIKAVDSNEMKKAEFIYRRRGTHFSKKMVKQALDDSLTFKVVNKKKLLGFLKNMDHEKFKSLKNTF